jgi:N-acetylmuramoyl-L-alanine amidase
MSQFRWIIDNGHGRNTRGKRSPEWDDGSQLFEFKFNRQVAFYLFELLIEAGVDYSELVPELKDVSLRNRTKRAKRIAKDVDKPCVFVSIHGNGYEDPNVNGIETFHFPGSDFGNRVAEEFQQQLITETGWHDRGVKTARYWVLRKTPMPSILTESGFYTNFAECQKMLSSSWQKRIAYAHYQAILNIEQKFV